MSNKILNYPKNLKILLKNIFCNNVAKRNSMFYLCTMKIRQSIFYNFNFYNFYFLILVISIFLTIKNTFAQEKIEEKCTFSLEGTLHDAHHQPLTNANVFLKNVDKNTNKFTTTDTQGKYKITELCAGNYTLVCEYVGFQTLETTIFIDQNTQTQQITLADDEASHLLDLTIIGEKISLTETSTQAFGQLSGVQLQRQKGKSLGEMLKEITGVNTLQTGNTISKPVIHGLHSNRVLILNNGIRQEGQQWGAEHAPEIDAMLATRLTVIKGANAVRYGVDAMGGVILVEPPLLPKNDNNQGKTNGKTDISGQINALAMSNGRGGVISGHLEQKFHKNWAGRLQSTYKRMGDVESPNYMLTNTAMKELNFSGNIGFKKENFEAEAFFSSFQTDLGIMRNAHSGNLTDLANAIDKQTPQIVLPFGYFIDNPRQNVQHNLLKLNFLYKNENLGNFSLQYGFQDNKRREYDRRVQVSSDVPTLDLDLQTHTLDAFWEKFLGKKWQSSAGINLSSQYNTYNARTGIRPLVPQYQNQGFGAFFIQKYIERTWELELGVRYDYRFLDVKKFNLQNVLQNPQFTFQNTSLNVGFLYHLPKNSHFRINVSSAWRPPNVAELFSEGLHHGSGVIEEGNATLSTEKAYKMIASFQRIFTKENKFALQADIYGQYIDNYIFAKPSEIRATIRGFFPVFNYTQTPTFFYGLDLSYQYEFLKNVQIQGKASFIHAQNLGNVGGKNLIFIPANRTDVLLQYEIPSLRRWKNIIFQGGFLWVFRQNQSPKTVSVRELSEGTSNIDLKTEIFDFSPPPPAYFLLQADVSAVYPLKKNKEHNDKKYFIIGIRGENLANVAYRDYMNRFRYYADEIGRNITLRLQFNF